MNYSPKVFSQRFIHPEDIFQEFPGLVGCFKRKSIQPNRTFVLSMENYEIASSNNPFYSYTNPFN